MFVVLNNTFVPEAEATLHISDLSIQRGYGVFDFFKVVDGHPYFLNDYFDRFYHSASMMRLPVPCERPALKDLLYELIRRNNMASSGVKIILTGGYSPDGYQPSKPNLIISQHPLTLPSEELIRTGIKIITHEYVRDIPEVKNINYTMGIWLIDKINEYGAADVLYTQNGIVSEFPRSNFFIITKDKKVLTPSKNVLRGVTRKNVLQVASQEFEAREQDIFIEDIYHAAEAFVTSTTKRILPITNINQQIIGEGRPGPISQLLLSRLIDLERQDRSSGK